MGLCGSKENLSEEDKKRAQEARVRSRELDNALQRDRTVENGVNKLLLLGAGESGKSTLFKQMVEIYGEGYSLEQRRTYVAVIHSNVIASMKTLCEQSIRLSEEPYREATAVAKELEADRQLVLELKGQDPIDQVMALHLKQLWADPGIQNTYALRSRFQLMDSTEYFMKQIDEIAKPGYVPSVQDVLRSRVRTTGIVEHTFIIDQNTFKLFDVGGQRNERKKWIHCFSEVTAVIFVAAMNEYDMVLFEDETTNRMQEALQLFEEICNSQWFKKSSMILFLNKKDLFQSKIAKVPLTVCFPDYNGLNNEYEAGKYIEQEFLKRNRSPNKEIYVHRTCATDTDTMRVVFDAVRDTVIRRSLAEGGLLAPM